MAGQDASDRVPAGPGPTVLVVEPDPKQREPVEAMLRQAGFEPLGVASGAEALDAARRERPHLVVLEVRLGDMSGYELCRALRDEFGDALGILFASAYRKESEDIVAGLLIGADDYVAKPVADGEMVARIRALSRRADAYEHLRSHSLQAGLTSRELEVLHLLAEGLDQRAIAEQLVVAHATVGKHIEHILAKLPARSRAEAVAIAYQRGLHSTR
jgi:DNA-binding NarL/FixJ family response regulator